jgi:fumarate hydratase class II
MLEYREERDTMGIVRVPADAYFGAQTQRAVENFSISGLRFPPSFVAALGLIKMHAAEVNLELGLLAPNIAPAIITAASEVAGGGLDDQFVVDVFQTGSGTSTNMNANEVIAGRGNEILTGTRGGKTPVHPNDHVNMGQSSNDVVPTAIHVSAMLGLQRRLIPALEITHRSLREKSLEFADVRKMGRTHLQDAVPMTLGQEFSGFARQVELGMARIRSAQVNLSELALGGAAVGTGANAHTEFAFRVIERLSKSTGCSFREAENHFAAQAAQDAAVETSGALKTIAVSLTKIANDIRWLASGPRCGLGEINIPSLQPGSSIMPGKVNPVIPEALIQAAAQVVGNDAAITLAGQGGNFQLNAMLPVIAYNLLQSIDLLSAASVRFAEKCVDGVTANKDKCAANIELSLAMCTPLVPKIGYDLAAAIAKEAYESGDTVREVALRRNILPKHELDELLDHAAFGKA